MAAERELKADLRLAPSLRAVSPNARKLSSLSGHRLPEAEPRRTTAALILEVSSFFLRVRYWNLGLTIALPTELPPKRAGIEPTTDGVSLNQISFLPRSSDLERQTQTSVGRAKRVSWCQ